MIKYNPKTWFTLIFHSYSRHVLQLLLPALFLIGLYTAVVCYIIIDVLAWHFPSTTVVHSLLGIVLGLFLVFRMNSAYDRWWEGRKLWGSLVNNTRNLAFKLDAFLPPDDKESRHWFVQMIPNFVIAMREELRDCNGYDALDIVGTDFPPVLKEAKHLPNMITALIYKRVNRLYKTGVFTGNQLIILDKELKSFSDICGACERIKNTPIPYSYSMYIKKFIFTFVVTLPFAFVTTLFYITIPIVLFIFFILLSIELIAEEIEEPFGTDVNDLPLDSLTNKIKSNVREVMIH